MVVQVGILGNRPQEDVLSRLQKKQKKAWKQEGGQTDERGEAHGGITRMRGPDAWRHGLCTHVMVGGWPKVCGGQRHVDFMNALCGGCVQLASLKCRSLATRWAQGSNVGMYMRILKEISVEFAMPPCRARPTV